MTFVETDVEIMYQELQIRTGKNIFELRNTTAAMTIDHFAVNYKKVNLLLNSFF